MHPTTFASVRDFAERFGMARATTTFRRTFGLVDPQLTTRSLEPSSRTRAEPAILGGPMADGTLRELPEADASKIVTTIYQAGFEGLKKKF